MGFQTVFKRYEKKYVISINQRNELMALIGNYVRPDEYGRSEICNIYYDTSDFRLIRRSIEKPIYKEKLRLRTYGTPQDNSNSFVELKKKYKGVVYKRRMQMPYSVALAYLAGSDVDIKDSQVKREIDYFLSVYPKLEPTCAVFYDREAFYCQTDRELRLTFDYDIMFSNEEPYLSSGPHGDLILDSNKAVLEIKCIGSMPLWLVDALAKLKIYPVSFSKYGTAYTNNFLYTLT